MMSEPEILLQAEEAVREAAADTETETTDANVVNDPQQQEQQPSSPLSPSASVEEFSPDLEAFVNNGAFFKENERKSLIESNRGSGVCLPLILSACLLANTTLARSLTHLQPQCAPVSFHASFP
jgi:hypothetical protein